MSATFDLTEWGEKLRSGVGLSIGSAWLIILVAVTSWAFAGKFADEEEVGYED